MSASYKNIYKLKVAENLLSFVNDELLKDTGINPEKFWLGFDEAAHELAIKNKELIKKRENIQKKIDQWHIENRGNEFKLDEYKKFLKQINYIIDEGEDFDIETDNVDDEITKIAGPQLVVPIMNARYTLNAATVSYTHLTLPTIYSV